VTTVTLDKTC